MECVLELARAEDAAICSQIIDEGRQFQQEQGFVQWTAQYPNIDTIRADIEAGIGYVLKVDGETAGYLCVNFGGEPAYASIDGAWSADEPYAVIQRMAFRKAFQGIGLADAAFAQIEKLCLARGVPYMRANTGFENKRMQHLLPKNGFTYCGVIVFQGSGKYAYDKLLR